MSGGLKLIFRCSVLPPLSQSAAVTDGSHVTVASGNMSYWKYSICEEIIIQTYQMQNVHE